MRIRIVAIGALILALGLSAPLALACDQQRQVSTPAVLAMLGAHGTARQSLPGVKPAACAPDGDPCETANDCCSGVCKTGEGRVCAPK
jgi:hypothetical protein